VAEGDASMIVIKVNKKAQRLHSSKEKVREKG
jgi:hypothetical protein